MAKKRQGIPKPKKPTLKKLPKKPLKSDSLEKWEKYNERCTDVQKENDAKVKEYNKEYEAYEKKIKSREKLQGDVEASTVKMKG